MKIPSALAIVALAASAAAAPVQPLIQLDQFGWLPDSRKIAVLADPQTGYDAALAYTPGAALEVRKSATGAVVLSGAPVPWNGGAVHGQSGNKVWWFDFSALHEWGNYYIYDPANEVRSYGFEIGNDVYRTALRHAARMFYYQRSGFAKVEPFADARWTDAASHLGAKQDLDCRLVTDPSNAALSKDLSGGWFDAGDFNKYVNFSYAPLHNLLFAWSEHPEIWTDDFGIPESGNGIPDILDEVSWELAWLKRMQQADGSVLSKVSVTGFESASPASADHAPRRYGAASTSATLTVASIFAHASRVFASAGQTAEAADLLSRAGLAWTWANANPGVIYTNSGFSSANPEVDLYERDMRKLTAAVQLFAATGNITYRSYVDANYASAHAIQWYYFYGFEGPTQDALLEYTSLPGATPAVKSVILNRKQSSINGGEFLPAFTGKTDGYRAYLKDGDYVWGSNQIKAQAGLIFQAQLTYGVDLANAGSYRDVAEGYLHYLHGINPNGIVYLTHMNDQGAGKSCDEMYHGWFGDGTVYDNASTSAKGPPPGYLTGGANPTYTPDNAYSGPVISPPQNQPTQKSYKDWNTSYPQNSWQLTEPAIYYQAAYLRLLSSYTLPLDFAAWSAGHNAGPEAADPDGDGLANLVEYALGSDPGLPSSGITFDPATREITYHLARGRHDIRTALESSADLSDWHEETATVEDLPGNDFLSLSYVDESTARRFFRLKVTRLP